MDLKLNDTASTYAVTNPAAANGSSPVVYGVMITVIVLFVALAIVLGVYYGMQNQSPKSDPAYNNLVGRQPKQEMQMFMGGGQQPAIGPLGYERNYPRQLTPAEMAAISLGNEGSRDTIAGPRNGGAAPASGTGGGAPVLNIAQLEKLVADGVAFTVILFSKTCPACTRLVNSVGQWAADGTLDNSKVALLETSEWGKAADGVVKDALATKAVPLSVNFKDGAANGSQLGAMPKDAFMKFIAQ